MIENTRIWYNLTWISGARPPVHPNPMTGRHSFETFDEAIKFFNNLAHDSQLISLVEEIIVTKERNLTIEAKERIS